MTDHALELARAGFLEGGAADLRGVPRHVAASWQRSVRSGVLPSEVSTTYYTDLDLGSRLVRCAGPVIEELAEQIGDVPTCVALTDDKARLLARRDSSSWFGRVADRVSFAQGFGYAEHAVGTNGVGTVLEFGESVHIVGAEHFVDTLQPFACAGAPVRDPFTGRIEGVLDISCLAEHSSPILHSLVRSAAARIERNLLADRDQSQQALFDAYTRVDARGRHAVVAVGPRIVMANATMQTLLSPTDQEALHEHVRFVMRRTPTADERVDLPSGVRVRLRGTTVSVGADVAGMVGVVALLDGTETGPIIRPGPVASPAWRLAASTVESALRVGDAVLVLGEPGAGRFTLLARLHRQLHVRGRVVAVEASGVEAAPREVAARLRRPAADAVLHVLRDVDTLSRAATDALCAALGGDPAFPGPVAATATDPGLAGALLAAFRASATVPPLRHRTPDLPGLVTGLLAELAPRRNVRLSPDALRLVARFGWPGNVTQLADALTCALRRRPVGLIEADDLPTWCQSAPRSALRPVDEIERDAIVAALRDAGGNRVAAATALGLARSTLYRKIRQYGITA
jgi:sigma-54 dependent transcriptional regulator, acetoin dehydrogenase operon transcriptional activator AcoR